MSVTTLTRAKLVTREIVEALDYITFGNAMIAAKVTVNTTGVDSFKSEHYAIIPEKKFNAALKNIVKDKGDFSYRDNITSANESHYWLIVTAADLKKFQKMPDDKQNVNYAYSHVMALQEVNDTPEKVEAYRKKVSMNAFNKGGKNLIRFKWEDHSFHTIDGQVLPVPMGIDYGITSATYDMKAVVDYLRELPHVRIRGTDDKDGWDNPVTDYPEITSVPYYNAEFNGETEIKVWVLPNQQQMEIFRGEGRKYQSFDLYNAQKHGVFNLEKFKLKRND